MAGLTRAQLAEKKERENQIEEKIEETPEEQAELCLGLVDGSSLSHDDRIRTIVQLLKRLPAVYMETEEQVKQNIWNLTRFEPTNKMLAEAQEIIDRESFRNQG